MRAIHTKSRRLRIESAAKPPHIARAIVATSLSRTVYRITYATRDVLGIYGISTVPAFRRRGFATALVRAAVTVRPELPVSVQPDPESVPIYTGLEFLPAGHVAAWHNGR